MGIRFDADWRQVRAEFDRLDKMPEGKLHAELDAILHAAFLDTQALTHVITGSLKLSGKENSSVENDEWTGEITYGGPSAGPNNPVRYAIYEMQRGGDHDFFRTLPGYNHAIELAIQRGLERDV